VRIHRVGDEAIDWRRGTAIEAIRQHRVDDRSLENSMERAGIVDRIRYARDVERQCVLAVTARPPGQSLCSSLEPSRPCRSRDRSSYGSVGDVVDRRGCGIRSAARRRGIGRSKLSRIRPLAFRPAAEHYVAGEETLVVTALTLGYEGILAAHGRRVVARQHRRLWLCQRRPLALLVPLAIRGCEGDPW
jgi:hypothetical protein